ncbi:cyclopropane fatty acyl phospholipid synthase [Candidatus Uhrbacteria bacterium]|nr:MAG: cyclopropane fatty acyl phospholipid synthase [Candidatus Uhrbacteria bacterium]
MEQTQRPTDRFRRFIDHVLEGTDVRINGDRPWDIRVKDERLFARVLSTGTLGFGEAYMDGWWECDAIDEMIDRLLRHDVRKRLKPTAALVRDAVHARLINRQHKRRAFHIGERHYDIGNDLYGAMLDRRLTYTCGYWSSPTGRATNLDEAQEAKLDLVCRKIGLQPGQRVLDIGCGWGSFAKFAAEKYGAHVVGITVSKEQVALGTEFCRSLPVELRLQDYRDVHETFDHVISLGMFEHVGYKNYHEYFRVVRRCLKPDGLFLLHTIGGNVSARNTDPWIDRYIFPNSMIPSAAQISRAAEGAFVMEDWHNFGADYDRTLMAWHQNVESHWPELSVRYDERFHRMWRYYLLSCAGSFRARVNQLWQVVFSPKGIPGGYRAVR